MSDKSIILLIFLLAALLPACKNTPACFSDSDCATDEYCLDNTCKIREQVTYECLKDSDCPKESDVCTKGRCLDSSRAHFCLKDSDCPLDKFCRLGIGDCVECLTSAQCDVAGGAVCLIDGRCGKPLGCKAQEECDPLYCREDTGECVECLDSSHCRNGRVCDLTAYYCRACKNNQDCGGAECLSGTCQLWGECDASSDCGGQACYQGRCTSCLDNTYCGEREYCETSSGLCKEAECWPGGAACKDGKVCRDRQCQKCLYDYECPSDKVCAAAGCVSGSEPGCSANSDCPGGLVCLSDSCKPCTANDDCTKPLACDLSKNPAICVDMSVNGPGALGATCTNNNDCNSGFCLIIAGQYVCSSFCIGSGLGHSDGTADNKNVDCPSGYQCHQANSGSTLDGHRYCVGAALLPAEPGNPFSALPGASCAAEDNSCQTSCDFASSSCRRFCSADRDCSAGEVCQAEYNSLGNPTGILSCAALVPYTSLKEAGFTCGNGRECLSGVCSGYCYTASGYSTRLCNNNNDCAVGETCFGVCRDPCRSGADCKNGEICTPRPLSPLKNGNYDGDLWINICDDPYYAYCSKESHCTSAETMADNYTPACVEERCSCKKDEHCASTTGICFGGRCITLAEGEPCTDDANCASEWCSLSGKCTSICAVDADCQNNKAGQKCRNTYYEGSAGGIIYSVGLCDN